MKQRRLVWGFLGVIDRERARVRRFGQIADAGYGADFGLVAFGPQMQQVGLAAARRTPKHQPAMRPGIGAIEPRARFVIARAGHEVFFGKAGLEGKGQDELPGGGHGGRVEKARSKEQS